MTPQDIYDACRVALGPIQRNSYMPWRDNRTRWYSDERLRKQIEEQRWEATYRRDRLRLIRVAEGDVFDLQTALEILLAGVSMDAQSLISSLDQLGVRWDTSFTEDYAFAFNLLDRPEVFDPIRETGLPLGDARLVLDDFGSDLLRLMWKAGLSGVEIVGAHASGQRPDEDALRMMAAFRQPAAS